MKKHNFIFIFLIFILSSRGWSDDSKSEHEPNTNHANPTCHTIEGGKVDLPAGKKTKKVFACPSGYVLEQDATEDACYTGTSTPCEYKIQGIAIELKCDNSDHGDRDVNHTYYTCCDPNDKDPSKDVCSNSERPAIETVAEATAISQMEIAFVNASISNPMTCDFVQNLLNKYNQYAGGNSFATCDGLYRQKITQLYQQAGCTFGLNFSAVQVVPAVNPL